MDIPKISFSAAGVFTLAATVLVLGGCASLDPTEDIAAAAGHVMSRTGADPAWTSPWDAPSDAWDGTTPLSADVAVRVALQNNRELRRQVEQIAASRAGLVQAQLLPNPVINVAFGLPTDSLGGSPLTTSVMQQLTWLWRMPAARDAAAADLQAQILSTSAGAIDLVARVRTGHARVFFAQEAIELQRHNIEFLRTSADLLERRFDVGEASRLDVNRAQLALRDAEISLTDREMTLDDAKRALLAMLGRADADVQWRAGDDGSWLRAASDLDEAAVMQLSLTQRLDVAAAIAVVEGHVARLDLEDRSRLPDLQAGVGYRQNFASRPGVFPAATITPKLFDDHSAQIARASSALRQAEIAANGTWQDAVTETRRAWIGFRAQQRVVESYEHDVLTLATSNASLAQQAYDVGETDLTVLLEAQQSLNDARIALVDRRLAASVRLIELERAVGGSLAPQDHDGEAIQ